MGLIDPVNRRPLTRGECASLDAYLSTYGLPPANITDAYDFSQRPPGPEREQAAARRRQFNSKRSLACQGGRRAGARLPIVRAQVCVPLGRPKLQVQTFLQLP